MSDPLMKLSAYTYELRHSPNCPSPFLIVTCGDAGRIGGEENLFSYGNTIEEAVREAVRSIEQHRGFKERLIRGRAADEAVRRVQGIVWA